MIFFIEIKIKQKVSVIFLYAFLFSFTSFSSLIYYLITLKLKYLCPEDAYFC